MANSNKRWGRLNEFNEFVEFTFQDPTGRFHKDVIWLEVDMTTQYRSRLTVLGTVEEPVDFRELKTEILDTRMEIAEKDAKKMEDNDAVLHEHWVESKELEKEEPNKFNASIDPDLLN